MKIKGNKLLLIRRVRKPFPMEWCVGLVAIFLAVMSSQVLAVETGTASIEGPPEYVDINIQKSCPDLKGLKKDLKAVNHFSHKAHIEALKKEGKGFVCATCHHGAKTEADILKADRCKRIQQELDATGGPGKLKDHFHGICLKCHKKLKKEHKATGPTSCRGCHSRKGVTE